MAYPYFALPMTVDATNNKLDFTLTVGGAKVATVASATYDDLWDLTAAVQIAMQAAGGGTETCAITSTAKGEGFVEIDLKAAGSLDWDNGPNTAVTIGTDLGFDVSADDTGSQAYDSDWQAPNGWWSPRSPARSNKDKREHVGGTARVTLSGSNVKRLTVTTRRKKPPLIFPECLPQYVHAEDATGAGTNQDFETFWITAIAGQVFKYFPDQMADANAVFYYMMEPSDLEAGIQRVVEDGLETYNIEMKLQRQE